MPKAYLEAVARADQRVNPLFRFLGARLERAEAGEAAISLPVTPDLAQGGGLVAGGILATLADEAMAHAVLSNLAHGQGAVTAEMNTRFLRPADPAGGGTLTATAKIVKMGRSTIVAEAAVRDEKKRLLVTAGATFAVTGKS